jgi:hypothetical protein
MFMHCRYDALSRRRARLTPVAKLEDKQRIAGIPLAKMRRRHASLGYEALHLVFELLDFCHGPANMIGLILLVKRENPIGLQIPIVLSNRHGPG